MRTKRAKYDRMLAGWRKFCKKGPAYRYAATDAAFAWGWFTGHAAGLRAAKQKKARKQ